jgi:hypothetical protein
MYYTPLQAGLILAIIVCFALWMTIIVESGPGLLDSEDGRLTPAQMKRILWLSIIGAIAMTAYLILDNTERLY